MMDLISQKSMEQLAHSLKINEFERCFLELPHQDNMEQLARSVKVNEIERCFLKEPQVECPVIHRFGPGVYMREVFLPKGSIVVGHHHNFEHMNVFLKGKMTLYSEDGNKELVAPMTMLSKPGRKIAFMHEDCVWVNVYATNETDVEKLEATLLTKSDAFLEDKSIREKVELLESHANRQDYFEFLNELNLSGEKVREISENNGDMTPLPFGDYKIKTGNSKIEGTGLFATADILRGEFIAPARILGRRTIAGRFTNHSSTPNARMLRLGNDDIALVATKEIAGCKGGQDGEEITINYRDAFKLNLMIGESKCQQ